jgi:hypothetical protein
MTNGKWLLLIFFIALIVLTFFIMKEYNNQPPSDNEGYSSMCEDIIVNDKTTVNGKTFTPPERGSTDMASYMKFLTSVGIVPMEKTTVNPMTKIGNYVDGADRRIPALITWDRTTPEQCAQLAKDRGFKIAGIQWQGECWGGNDLGRALSYNNSTFHNPSNPADFAYGRPWNNLVMTNTTTKSCSVNRYSEYISGLLENNITSYAQLKTINHIEPFVGGPNPPPPGSSPIVSSDFDSVSKSITIPKFGLLKQDVQALVNEVNKSNTNINL